MDATFLQEICVSLKSNSLALKLKDHIEILDPRNDQDMKSQFPDSEVIDLESLDHRVPCPQIHKSHGDEMPRDNSDPKVMF